MQYFDELIVLERKELEEQKEFQSLIQGSNIDMSLLATDNKFDITKVRNIFKKNLIKYIRLGLLEKTESPGIYRQVNESIASPIYAKCLTDEFLTRKKHLDKLDALIHRNVTPNDVEKVKEEVRKIGFSADEYVLLCQLTVVMHKAFADNAVMDDVTELFKLLFKNVDKDFQYSFYNEHLSIVDVVSAYIDRPDSEKTACVFLAHRYAKELTVHIWSLIHSWLILLLPNKSSNAILDSDEDIRYAYDRFALETGIIVYNRDKTPKIDPRIASVIEECDLEYTSEFIEGCRFIDGLQKELIKYLEKDLQKSFESKTPIHQSNEDAIETLKFNNTKLTNLVTQLEEKCARLQNAINAAAVDKEMLQNKYQKEFETLTNKYQKCMDELKAYKQSEVPVSYEIPLPHVELKDKRIMIIGGHDRWHQIIKSVYPDWILVNDEKTLPTDLRKVDGIFFFTKYMSHCLYKKYVNQCRAHNIPFYYLTSLNLQAVEEQIKLTLGKE